MLKVSCLVKAVIATVILMAATTSMAEEQEFYNLKIGLLAPWNGTFEDFSALTSASAVSIALERINNDPSLAGRMNIR